MLCFEPLPASPTHTITCCAIGHAWPVSHQTTRPTRRSYLTCRRLTAALRAKIAQTAEFNQQPLGPFFSSQRTMALRDLSISDRTNIDAVAAVHKQVNEQPQIHRTLPSMALFLPFPLPFPHPLPLFPDPPFHFYSNGTFLATFTNRPNNVLCFLGACTRAERGRCQGVHGLGTGCT